MEKLQCEKFIYSATKLKLSRMDKLTHLHYIIITSTKPEFMLGSRVNIKHKSKA